MLVFDVINLARLDLNDDDKTRHSDIKLLAFLNNYVQEAIKNRPDLFVGQYLQLPSSGLTLGQLFPMPNRYVRSCADFIIARTMMINTEEGAVDKASAYLTLSAKGAGL